MNLARCRSKNAQVTTGIHDSGRDSVVFQHSHRAIDRETLGDPAKIDNQASPKKNFAIPSEKNVPPARGVRFRTDGDIENAVAFPCKSLSGEHYLPSPGIHDHAFRKRVAVHARDIAVRIVKAHEAMDPGDLVERRGDRAINSLSIFSARGNFHKRAEQRAATTQFNV